MKIKSSMGILLLTLVGAAYSAPANGLPFISNNFPEALLQAKLRKAPIFVECWAPW